MSRSLRQMISVAKGAIEVKNSDLLITLVPEAYRFFKLVCENLEEKFQNDDFKSLASMRSLVEMIGASGKSDREEFNQLKQCFREVMSDDVEFAQNISYLYILSELARKCKDAKSDDIFFSRVTAFSRILRSHINFNYHNKADATFLDDTDRKSIQDNDGKTKKKTKLYPSEDTPISYMKPDRIFSDGNKGIKYFRTEEKKELKVKLEGDVVKRHLDDEKMPCDRYIFVITKKGGLYARKRVDDDGCEIKHSSFKAGKAVMCAGEIEVDANGKITSINHKSGHYMPNKFHLAEGVRWLLDNGFIKEDCRVSYNEYDHEVKDGFRVVDAKSFLESIEKDYGYKTRCIPAPDISVTYVKSAAQTKVGIKPDIL
jgi:hypothetical protein